MRRRTASSLVGLILLGAFVVSCGQDAERSALPTSPVAPRDRQSNLLKGGCLTLPNLITLVHVVFDGSPNSVLILLKVANLDAQVRQGNTAAAQAQARDIVAMIQAKVAQGNVRATRDQIQSLISGILCYAGLSPDTFLVLPSDQTQVLVSNGGGSGVMLPANAVNEPALLTITVLPTNAPPLTTKLDQYPGFILLTQTSPLLHPAVVGVCPASGIDPTVLGRLRLGHQATGGFEITPAADAGFLDCSTAVGQSTFGKLLQRVAKAILPKPLYAKTEFRGGIGGLVSEFSPFAPVDPELNLRGGIGGLVSEFKVAPPVDGTPVSPSPASPKRPSGLTPNASRAPDARVNTVVNGVCTQADATVGTNIENECRPVVTITTFKGTVFQTVPVGWTVDQGGGVVAAAAPGHVCGAYATTASTTTNANGNASICWQLGGLPGVNTVIATPTIGGDANVADITFSPANLTFTAVATQITPTAGATGGTFVYDGLPHTGAGTCTNGLTPALSYGGASVPTNAGTYTLTVTCGAGNPVYVTVTQTAAIQITAAPTTAGVTCPESAVYTGSPLTPCTATVTGPGGLSQSLTPTYTANVDVGTATANAVYPASANYQTSTASATFNVTPAGTTTLVSCPASVVFANSAQTPCTAKATGPGLNATLTPSYGANVNVGAVTASASYAGSGNYASSNGSATFQITPAPTTTIVSCPASVVFTGSPQTPCSAAANGPGLNVAVTPSYVSNVNGGTATATAMYPGGGNYLPSTGSGMFTITGAATSAAVSCPTFVWYTGSAVTPCTGSVTGPGLSQSVTPTYTSNVVGAATATVNYLGGGNYLPSTASKGFQIYYVQAGCFGPPVASLVPSLQSFQKKGGTVPIKCTLLKSQGGGVSGAHGDLVVQDMGLTGFSAAVTVLTVTNAFTGTPSGNYSYNLDTSPSKFVSSHFYVVKATWTDGSTSVGWFYLKSNNRDD